MKAKFLRLLILSSFLVTGCSGEDLMFWKKKNNVPEQQENEDEAPQGGEQTPEQDPYLKKTVSVRMEALLKGDNSLYSVDYEYDDKLFLKDAEEYDKDLSLLSFGAAISGTYKNWVEGFLRDCEFEDTLTHDLDEEPTKDTLGYALAHKSIDDNELFSVIVRGHEYKREWENNFLIGETGDHEGWSTRASELYVALSNYINEYKGEKTIKLWIVGYSRAGAISNILSSLIFKGNGFSVNAKNMYVYTFEAPAGITRENAEPYKNVHNIVNSADIVTYIPPKQYDFYRAGVDFEIYDMNFGTYVANFDNSLSVPAWVPCDKTDFNNTEITNDVEFAQYLIDDIFKEYADETVSAHTRELYVANYQSGLSYAIGLLLGLSGTTRSQLMADLQSNPMNMLVFFDTTGVAIADFLKTYLNRDNLTYDYDELVAACAKLSLAVQSIFSGILSIYTGGKYTNNLTRVLDMHYPEVTYCLLKNAHSKL